MDIRARKKAKARKRRIAKVLLLTNFIVFILWLISQNIDVYEYAAIGAICEMLWLPVWGCFFLVPLISMYNWHQDGYKKKSRFLFVLLVSVFMLVMAITSNYF
jgi:amino acid permease